MSKFEFTITGRRAMLMHADDVLKADSLSEFRKAPENKKSGVAGDDRSPPWTWITYLYEDGENVVIPSQNLMVALRKAGGKLTMKKQTTFKEVSQSGLLIGSENLDFLCNGKRLPIAAINKLRDLSFIEQSKAVEKLGFKLFVKRAAVGASKHVRVRPRFDVWSAAGIIEILDPAINEEVLSQLFTLAGSVGLGDWRPGCKTPGPFGMFSAKIKPTK